MRTNSHSRVRPNHTIREILLTIILGSFVCWLILHFSGVTLTKNGAAYFIAALSAPLASLAGFSFSALNGLKDIDGLRYGESEKLNYIIRKRLTFIKRAMSLYTILAFVVCLYLYIDSSRNLSYLFASVVVGVFIGGVYTSYAAWLDQEEVGDFKAKLAAKARAKEKSDEIDKKVTLPSK